MSDVEMMNLILHELNKNQEPTYVLPFCIKKFGKRQQAKSIELMERLVAEGYAKLHSVLFHLLEITPEGILFIEHGGYRSTKCSSQE